jgi:MoaA/NifB/PqqE/SkfB family radical SAM enzyme
MSSFFCAAPWRGLHINPQGSVKTCCAGDPHMLGSLDSQTIEEILHGPVMQQVRQTLRQGQPHPRYCHNCVQAERYGTSERNWHNQINPGFDAGQATDTEHYPVLIDIRWNTTCNFSCNYCNEHSSSQWASLKKLSVQSGTRPYYEQVCNYIEQHQQHIKKVALIGGEPLLLKENERLLEVMPAHCRVDVITNLGVDLENNRIFKKLSERNNVGWNVSLDNTGDRFEYVRYGGSWSQIESNIAKIKSCAGHRVGIHPLYNIYNATRLTDLIVWAQQQDISLHWQNLYHPAYLDPLQLSTEIQQLALKELRSVLSRHDLEYTQRKFFQETEMSYIKAPPASLTEELINHIGQIESKYHSESRGQFRQLWPELASIL